MMAASTLQQTQAKMEADQDAIKNYIAVSRDESNRQATT